MYVQTDCPCNCWYRYSSVRLCNQIMWWHIIVFNLHPKRNGFCFSNLNTNSVKLFIASKKVSRYRVVERSLGSPKNYHPKDSPVLILHEFKTLKRNSKVFHILFPWDFYSSSQPALPDSLKAHPLFLSILQHHDSLLSICIHFSVIVQTASSKELI